MKKVATLLLVLLTANLVQAQTEDIRLNQLGFYPESEKVAIVLTDQAEAFSVVEDETGEIVFEGETSDPDVWPHSGESVVIGDFSEFEETGRFLISVDGKEDSYPFAITEGVHKELASASVRYYYFNRASMELEEEYAGPWARPLGHPDDEVIVHSSAATEERPEGFTFSSPKGWYDAGDFNKYIVNSGISTYTLMAAYKHFPEFYDALDLNIPESENQIPDILDEVRWNLDWMLTMQDPNDGGVYHKLTTLNFAAQVMPHQSTASRYVVMKSTAATLNFAAVMATASRVYRDIDPDFSDEALDAAEFAWQWAKNHPEIYYEQPSDVYTGEYGDSDVEDEFDWAAAELYITTEEDQYWEEFNQNNSWVGIPGWQSVRPLAWVSLAHHVDELTDAADTEIIENRIINQADDLLAEYESSAYGVSMGQEEWHFLWGSNGMALNHSVMLLQAYRLTLEESYLDAAQSNLDYILGRNATGYSFVTGFGSRPPMNPHHRQSAADNVTDPVPGMVVGGPHNGQQDGCNYPSDQPAKSYVDSWCSYATNEVTINWNAPLVYVSGAVDYLRSGIIETDITAHPERPESVQLSQNYPNPFNPSTVIEYQLSEPGYVSLELFDMAGRRLLTIDDGSRSVGTHSVQFDAGNLASGLYLYRLTAGDVQQTKKMILIK